MNNKINKIYPSEYPFLLQQIRRQPPHLYVQGTLPPSHYIYLCVIGSREPSSYGAEVCKHLIQGLAGHPIAIISGLAVGIDSYAHEVALATGLPTIAFPGTGLSERILFPYSGRHLARQIVESGGALVSPFEIDQYGTRWSFPERNRLMAGISKAVLIIEGKEGSGTLGTATYAEEFNREVMVVPGSIFSDLSYGPHLLMKDGAHPVTNSQEILDVLGFERRTETTLVDQPPLWSSVEFSPLERKIIEQLSTPAIRDDILRNLGVSFSQANATISELEIKGILKEEGGILRLIRRAL